MLWRANKPHFRRKKRKRCDWKTRVFACVGGLTACITYAISISFGGDLEQLMETEIKLNSVEANVSNSGKRIDRASNARKDAEPGAARENKFSTDAADAECIFRDSPIYRKVYVYPNPGEVGWEGDILSAAGHNRTAMRWPWLALDKSARENARCHYNIASSNVQYATELLVRELMINPQSCLRTLDPEEAILFYVPYLPSIEHHVGHDTMLDYSPSPYGKAIFDIVEKQDYSAWEKLFGLTSKYWRRRGGSDHILVFSEPMHGLFHPRSKRGNYHYIHTQKQLTPPIVISVELSTTFVSMYPNCAAKNILVPYPNTHGDWFNGAFANEAQQLQEKSGLTTALSKVALPAERKVANLGNIKARPVAQYYAAGNHGTCVHLRKAMAADYKKCSASYSTLNDKLRAGHNTVGMRLTTFCPCPGGDSPSAKRMFDALIAGCVPVILSKDFVWPFTKDFDSRLRLDPADFSIRLNATDFDTPKLDSQTCKPLDEKRPGLQAYLESISEAEIERLRRGVTKAGQLYSWYAESDQLPSNPLRDGVLPDGGTAHYVVRALGERAKGTRWPACEEELKKAHGPDPKQFMC